MLLYRQVVGHEEPGKDKTFQRRFAQNDWKGIWKNGIYDYHHFHPDAHEALGIANATDYGLASAVWTSNLSRAHRMVRGIKAGVVHVNTTAPPSTV